MKDHGTKAPLFQGTFVPWVYVLKGALQRGDPGVLIEMTKEFSDLCFKAYRRESQMA